jgi:putative ABC transport system permease protein
MLANYLKIVLAQLRRHKLQASINILGLSVGIASCLLIVVYVLFELSYDRYHANADRIYRVSDEMASGTILATTSALTAPTLQEEFPQIEAWARIYANTPGLISRGDISAYDSKLRFADGSLFRIFDFEWLQGDPATALSEPNTVVITESTARKYFADENPMGQILELETARYPMEVVGVVKDLPDNTHLDFNLLASVDLGVTRSGRTVQNVLENWSFDIFHTYLLLEEGADMAAIEAQFPDFVARHIPPTAGPAVALHAMALRDIHLYSRFVSEYRPTGSPRNLVVLGIIAVLVLLIACVNFMNLATARASQRAREIGMRKAMGADKDKLVFQFLGEAIGMTIIALILALVIVELMFPAFTAFTGKHIGLSWLRNGWIWLAIVVAVLVTGLAAGSYPAFYLSAFEPSKVLRGDLTRGRAGVLFRNVLVVAQFSASIALIVATSVVFLQMRFAREADLGFETEKIVIAEGSLLAGLGPQWRELVAQIARHPDVVSVGASSSGVPLRPAPGASNVRAEGSTTDTQLWFYQVAPNYLETYGIDLVAGRTFSADRMADLQLVRPTAAAPQTRFGVVLNLMAARQLGWTAEEAVGKEFRLTRASPVPNGEEIATVIGVVQDAWLESVRAPIKPIFFLMPPDLAANNSPNYGTLSMRIASDDMTRTLADIEQIWQRINPDIVMRTRLLEQDFETVYAGENLQGQLFLYFSTLAVILACCGLLGLAAFNAERRTREIGVRKVMGGSVWSIVVLLTSDFSKLVLISNLIAWPLAYFAMESWLQNFAYRIDLTPMIFIGSGLIALCIAWVTVGGTAAKAAAQKPVLALRYE